MPKYYIMIPSAEGNYVNADGERFMIDCCRSIRTREGYNVGYQPFESEEEAAKAFRLSAADVTP